MSNKFSRLLMTGKAATLPFLMSNAQAIQTWTPSMYDVVTDKVTQVQIPINQIVELVSLGAPNSVYNGSATICNVNGATANKLGVVLTGLRDRDTVYVIISENQGGNQNLHPSIKIGNTKTFIAKALVINAPSTDSISATVSIDLNDLSSKGYSFVNGAKFYMQTVVVPPEALTLGFIDLTKAKITEMDVVTVNACSRFGPHGQVVY